MMALTPRAPSTLTGYLNGMYGTMVYAVSASEQQQQAQNANANTEKINSFWGNDWVGQFGPSTPLYGANETTQWSWVVNQKKYGSNIPESQKFDIIRNSLSYVCMTASLENNKSIALNPAYQNYEYIELQDLVYSGETPFDDIFTGLLNADGEMNPWTQQMYTEYVTINNSITNNSKDSQSAASNTGLINTAGTYLTNYVSGNNTQMANLGNYPEVYTNGEETTTYPEYVPQVTYNKNPSQIASIITATEGGDSVTAGVYTADGSSDTVKIGSSSSTTSSYSGAATDWFWTTSVSATMSSSNQQSFKSYDSAAASTQGVVDYGNLSFQQWDIPETGNNAWLLSSAVQAAVNNKTPYVYSSNFEGGYGWTSSADAATYTQGGLSYMKSLAFSGNPTTTITVKSNSSGSQYWTEDNYESSSYSASGGFSFGDWFGAVGVGASTSSGSTYSDATNSSTWNKDSNTATLTSNPLGPIATTVTDPNSGYPAMQVGAGIVEVVAPNSNYSSSASSKGTIKTNWHVVNPDTSGKNVKLDKTDNIVFGSHKRDVIKASKGDDELYGHKGRDALSGGKGDDFISGGLGKDSYSGGPGKDYFELNTDHFGTGLVTIMDFNPKHDTLWFVHVNPDLLTTKGKGIYYDDDKIARVSNLSKNQVATIVEDNSSFVG